MKVTVTVEVEGWQGDRRFRFTTTDPANNTGITGEWLAHDEATQQKVGEIEREIEDVAAKALNSTLDIFGRPA